MDPFGLRKSYSACEVCAEQPLQCEGKSHSRHPAVTPPCNRQLPELLLGPVTALRSREEGCWMSCKPVCKAQGPADPRERLRWEQFQQRFMSSWLLSSSKEGDSPPRHPSTSSPPTPPLGLLSQCRADPVPLCASELWMICRVLAIAGTSHLRTPLMLWGWTHFCTFSSPSGCSQPQSRGDPRVAACCASGLL